jgi:hypothetical protein
VFVGTVTSITGPPAPQPIAGGSRSARRLAYERAEPVPFPQRTIRLEVGEAFLGVGLEQRAMDVETGLGGGDCGYPFQAGMDYLIYADKGPSGQLRASICSRTRPAVEAAEDIAYFHELANTPSNAQIRILTLDLTRRPPPGPNGLAGVQVRVDGLGTQSVTNTDQLGRATFTGLTPGEYTVTESLEGYTEGTRKVEVHAKGCADVQFIMRFDRRIEGRVFTKEGQPMADTRVELLDYDRPQRVADSARTDADGRYELRYFDTGDYYLGVNLDRTPNAQNPARRWFYPGAQDQGHATIIHVADAPGRQQYDLILPDPVGEQLRKGDQR